MADFHNVMVKNTKCFNYGNLYNHISDSRCLQGSIFFPK